MGRVKEQIIEEQEEDWVEENQKKWLNDKRRWSGFVYGDLINFDYLEDEKLERIDIGLVSGNEYTVRQGEILEANALYIKYAKNARLQSELVSRHIHIIPLDKIETIIYIFRP